MDEVILKKFGSLERCVARVQEEYKKAGKDFAADYSRQDAAILNIQRACEIAIDVANYLIKQNQWGIPSSSREAFDILENKSVIDKDLAQVLKAMVGFRNIAVHEYETLNIEVLVSIINKELSVFSKFEKSIFKWINTQAS